MNKFSNFMKNSTLLTKILILGLLVGGIWGASWGYKKLNPQKVKKTMITTKATGLPTLNYDKGANAPFRAVPSFNEPAEVQSPEIRLLPFGWNGFSAANYAVGGKTTSKGSICEELGLNVKLDVNNSMSAQLDQLLAFADGYAHGSPDKGYHGIILMADAWANYVSGLNERIKKDIGAEYIAKLYTFTGASFGEDFWAVRPKYKTDARGSLTCTVIRDGDWNICVTKAQLMGWPVNNDLGTYDKSKVNFVPAPNDDYTEAGKMYISGQKVTLKIVENGKITERDTTLGVTGVASWFPVDQQVAEKGGLVKIASTRDYASQMACGLVLISKWADDNPAIVEKLIEAFGRGGDQIKSHDAALRFASQVNEVVFADKEKDADAWYNAYKSFDVTDDDGNVMNIGGSRAFSIADAAAYTGVAGGTDKYKQIFTTFGNIAKEAYPEVLSTVPEYSECVDWKYLKNVYNKVKGTSVAGTVSKSDFTSSHKGGVIGDASYSIEFALGSAEISPKSFEVLDKIVGLLSVADNAYVEVSGHTDNTGNPAANQELSAARAASVARYLKQKNDDLGDAGKMSTKGYGQDKPLNPSEDQNSKAVRDKNRRVEIKLFKVKQ